MRDARHGTNKARIAHLAGPNATIHNTPPLVTSNKARAIHALPLLTDVDGNPSRYDSLRPQRLAVPVHVYIEQFSAHPLEADAAHLYAPPDGYVDSQGNFSTTETATANRPVFRVELRPEDGYYPLPYMARQRDGSAWETDGVSSFAAREMSRQPFMPDGSRTFEEVDRLGVDPKGRGSAIHDIADVEFYRVAPSGGYMNGVPSGESSGHADGTGAIEVSGRDFFPYRPPHLSRSPPRTTLARIANATQKILRDGHYDGAIWTQGSPRIEETIYWLNLVLDVTVPVCGNASQRYHGETSNDGPRNLIDSVHYISSGCWADAEGHNRAGAVLVQDQRVFAAREVVKVDARPGGFAASGGHGGIIGAASEGRSRLCFTPNAKHTYQSELNISRLPASVCGITQRDGTIGRIEIPIKTPSGDLRDDAIPYVSIVKDYSYSEDDFGIHPENEVDIVAILRKCLTSHPLAGFVLEGLSPYGKPASASKLAALERAVYCGLPIVCVGRGNTEGFARHSRSFIGGSNLTATKARMLLMLCIMKFGMLPPATDAEHPSEAERNATEQHLDRYRKIFDTH
ncbi:L-asparaginase/Glu-tRNA(Gln) amidotransferase subunit D [Neorhizobium galegae]|uniref:asparaginase domain-containing protein n=1 Tax=Neorhizobium galegae TaxID=399 RepID=UPI001AE34DFE|nr:asparaginase domain-containing protein [Neorhizobium galegae]MBP2561846.1 L-asparaginase/Glu-tRNA(Gln) amidotransferase subunit D [Neorhizobium galegae]MDQ0134849.1 L-asparaginase/Glu-tRNA(Gln) amidotransferase subunit D [Neorhizobium galegae]